MAKLGFERLIYDPIGETFEPVASPGSGRLLELQRQRTASVHLHLNSTLA
jgi:hypothetical protein